MSSQAESPFSRVLHRLRLAFWRRRLVHWLIRATWLALLVPIGVMIGYLGWGWQVPWPFWVYPMLLLWAGLMLWALRPIPLPKIVYRLDDRLNLRTRLITAFEVSQADDTADNPVVPRLLQETVTMLIDLRGQVRLFNRQLWLEIQTLTGVIAVLSALILLDALSPRLPNVPPNPLPPPTAEPAAAELVPPEPQLRPPPPVADMQIHPLEPDSQSEDNPPPEAERLSIEGQPLELAADDSTEQWGSQPLELEAETGDRLTPDSPFARGGGIADNTLGPDPLVYPRDKQEIVRRYFTP